MEGSAFLFGLRAGLYLWKFELAVELSPLTYLWLPSSPSPSFQVNATADARFDVPHVASCRAPPLPRTGGFPGGAKSTAFRASGLRPNW